MSHILSKIPDGVSGDWCVETFSVTEDDVKLHNMRAACNASHDYLNAGIYKRLMRGSSVVMTDTPYEYQLHREPIHKATGAVLINGLGLGVVLQAILDKPEVKEATVIEISEDVIKLVGPTFENDSRVTIICADALTWEPPKGKRYNVVWHDIWNDICADNLDEMIPLHRRYGRRCDWQGSWSRDECRYGRFGRDRR